MLIRPFMSSFSFLSSFQTLTIFVTFFSGTVRPRRFKLGTHMNDGQMCPVHRNQATDEYLSFCFFIYLSLQFSNINIFRHIFLRNCEAYKIESLYTHGQMGVISCILESG